MSEVKRVALIVVALGAVLAAYLYWSSDERQIRRLLLPHGTPSDIVRQLGGQGSASVDERESVCRSHALAFLGDTALSLSLSASEIVKSLVPENDRFSAESPFSLAHCLGGTPGQDRGSD